MPQRTGNPLIDDEEQDYFGASPDEGDPDELELAGIPSAASLVEQSELTPLGPSSADSGHTRGPAAQRYQDALARGASVYDRKKPNIWQTLGAGAVGGVAGWLNSNPKGRPVDASETIQNILYPGQKRREEQYGHELSAASQAAKSEQDTALAGARVGELGARATAEQKRGEAYDKTATAKIAQITKGGGTPLDKYNGLMQIPGMDEEWARAVASTGKAPLTAPEGKFVKVTPELGVKLGLQPNEKGEYLAPQAAIGANLKVENAPPPKGPTNEYEGTLKEFTAPDGTVDYAKANAKYSQTQAARRPVNNINAQVTPGVGGIDQNLTGDEYLAKLPKPFANQVRQIATGKSPLPSGAFARSPEGKQIRDAVFQFDPEFSEQRAQIRKAFTTGKAGDNIGALNTATVHLDQLADAADALHNGTFTPGNQAYNYFSSLFGQPAPTNFEALKNAVAGELANALKGSATDPEIANVSKAIQASASPAALKGAVETNLHTLGAKLHTYQERYQQQIPGDTAWSPVLPSAHAVYQKHGFDPIAAAPQQQGGGQPTTNPNPNGYVKSHVYGGLTYLGGDPNNAASWKK